MADVWTVYAISVAGTYEYIGKERELGHVVITEDDGTQIKRDLSSVIILHAEDCELRELLAMRQAHRLLCSLPADEARRVVSWLDDKFPPIPTMDRSVVVRS